MVVVTVIGENSLHIIEYTYNIYTVEYTHIFAYSRVPFVYGSQAGVYNVYVVNFRDKRQRISRDVALLCRFCSCVYSYDDDNDNNDDGGSSSSGEEV